MSEGKQFPAWHTGPNGERRIFNSTDEVPKGWYTRSELREKGKSAPVSSASTPAVGGPAGEEIDAHGHPWSADFHASSKNKTTQGLWRMKVGVARPDPKPGYPLDL